MEDLRVAVVDGVGVDVVVALAPPARHARLRVAVVAVSAHLTAVTCKHDACIQDQSTR